MAPSMFAEEKCIGEVDCMQLLKHAAKHSTKGCFRSFLSLLETVKEKLHSVDWSQTAIHDQELFMRSIVIEIFSWNCYYRHNHGDGYMPLPFEEVWSQKLEMLHGLKRIGVDINAGTISDGIFTAPKVCTSHNWCGPGLPFEELCGYYFRNLEAFLKLGGNARFFAAVTFGPDLKMVSFGKQMEAIIWGNVLGADLGGSAKLVLRNTTEDVDAPDLWLGSTALYLAVSRIISYQAECGRKKEEYEQGLLTCIEELVKAGADVWKVDTSTRSRLSPVGLAELHGAEKVLRILLKGSRDPLEESKEATGCSELSSF
ncbi:hypothetical protein BJ508DRAFT_329414 [Ascobolus immersus RN42]|uniref:Uncharacterized protein n=1 Tax=Ascobolus immersus RN42 TaxID=1160509 RepID=A0A3N4HX89_ASCIM|nr:hypothetical protein BJ508DRAFT_329414 [Ascobolus immersus RN42]